MSLFRTILFNRWSIRLLVVLGLLGGIWLFRQPLLRAAGGFLVKEDPLAHADVVYVLGGAPIERAEAGARLVLAGYAPEAVFTGEPPNELLQSFGIDSAEAGLGMHVAQLHGLPLERMRALRVGTSTAEEAVAVRTDAERLGADTILVVTTDFHTRRVSRVFHKVFRGSGTIVLVRATPSHHYSAARWWETEEGMIMVNNEYTKLMYYAFKH
ncbi:MAG: YdcF family protein [Flavobacteriales bacterium]|nr:YdcF family protein [Flavobacteriales bacterium]